MTKQEKAALRQEKAGLERERKGLETKLKSLNKTFLYSEDLTQEAVRGIDEQAAACKARLEEVKERLSSMGTNQGKQSATSSTETARANQSASSQTTVSDKGTAYDLPGGEKIPYTITLNNGRQINVTFGQSEDGETADHTVNPKLLEALTQVLNVASEKIEFHAIHIPTTTNGHEGRGNESSNHRVANGARALDISRIDGEHIINMEPNDPRVIALQEIIDELPNVRENFGPSFRHKLKRRHSNEKLRETHKDHIHFSINP